MRIIAGEFGGRVLRAPHGQSTRPTSGRLREALFQHLEAAVLDGGFGGLRVLDLFAGTGALAFEALSRGASRAVLVDSSREACAAARANAASLGCEARVRVISASLPAALSRLREEAAFDVVFVDPPWAERPAPEMLEPLRRGGHLSGGAVLAWEHATRDALALPEWLAPVSERRHGDGSVTVARFV